MRVLTGPPVVQVALEHPQYGTWGEADMGARDRKGIHPGNNAVSDAYLQRGATSLNDRILSDDELWAVYRLCPDVRASVEAIARVISTWDWMVEPLKELANDDPLYEAALDASEEARRFLTAPNLDGEVWQTFIGKEVRDLLVFDTWATENALGPSGELEELVSLPGGSVTPRKDRHGRTVGYVQESNGGTVEFSKDQIVYFNLFPNSRSVGGTPLIETLIHEVVTLVRQSKHLMLAYDADEVAPGVLLIAGLAGKAAERAVAGLRNMRGSDHKLRVLTTDNPKGLDARWVEFRRTPKDLDMAGLVKEIRRTIWRLFGVKPITMGDSEATPRATAEAQIDAEESGLIEPILELIEAHINVRVMPLLVGDRELAGLVKFAFDRDRRQSADEAEKEANADASDFDRGAITINEIRYKRGRLPVEGGDQALVRVGPGYLPLSAVLAATGTEGMVDDETLDACSPKTGEEAPGEAEAARPVGQVIQRHTRRPGIVQRTAAIGSHRCEPHRWHQRSSILPSEWQPGSRFEGYRTLNLQRLGRVLIDYVRVVGPLYTRAEVDTIATFRAYAADGEITAGEATELASRVGSIMDRLYRSWDTATEPHYRDAARLGRDAAADFTGVSVVSDWQQRADLYHQQAMSYLREEGGMISDVRAQLLTIMQAAVRGTEANEIVTRHLEIRQVEGIDVAALLGAVTKVFSRHRHRIQNWAGRLVELANETLTRGMDEGAAGGDGGDSGEETPGDPGPAGEWWVEWAAVGDDAMCATCAREGRAGFRPLSQVKLRPGGNTECRARCRCVLCFWRKDEVDSGQAVSLTGLG